MINRITKSIRKAIDLGEICEADHRLSKAVKNGDTAKAQRLAKKKRTLNQQFNQKYH